MPIVRVETTTFEYGDGREQHNLELSVGSESSRHVWSIPRNQADTLITAVQNHIRDGQPVQFEFPYQ